MRTVILLLSALGLAWSDVAGAQSWNWSRYTNNSLGLAIDLPTDLFSVDGGPTKNASGQSFRTADGRADVGVYSISNDARDTPDTFLRKRFVLPSETVVYRHVKNGVLAVSGFRDDRIWYARCNFAALRVNCVALNYPANEKRSWDPIVTRISNTLSHPRWG